MYSLDDLEEDNFNSDLESTIIDPIYSETSKGLLEKKEVSTPNWSSYTSGLKNLTSPIIDLELESILKKYSSNNKEHNVERTTVPSQSSVNCIEISSDEDEIGLFAKPDVTSPYFNKNPDPLVLPNTFTTSTSISDDNDNLATHSEAPKKKIRLSPAEKDRKKLADIAERERKKLQKTLEREKKKEEAEREKQIKQAVSIANKNLKPEECMKFISVLLDRQLANEEYGGEILNFLQAASITYRLESQLVPGTITWSRSVQTQVIDNQGALQQVSETVETSQVLILMNCREILDLIHTEKLCSQITSFKSILTDKKIFLGIYGVQDYFNSQKSHRQKELRQEITQSTQTSISKLDKKYKNVPKISKDAFEIALTELQILCDCCHQLLETKLDVARLIMEFTKAVAQIPFKAERHQKELEVDRYIWEDNKNVVNVGKDGTGLHRLWQQQLTSFSLARIEHAEAITAKYPTLSSLMEAYTNCTEKEGEKLLQDIPVRRVAGPLTTVRKIGPELSKKIYTVFTSYDGSTVF